MQIELHSQLIQLLSLCVSLGRYTFVLYHIQGQTCFYFSLDTS